MGLVVVAQPWLGWQSVKEARTQLQHVWMTCRAGMMSDPLVLVKGKDSARHGRMAVLRMERPLP